MNPIGTLLFLQLLYSLEGCLVIRTKECACPMLKLDSSNLNLVSDHSFYGNISKFPIKAPKVSGDKCSLSMYCEGEYNLVIFDKNVATNFGRFSADGLCQPGTQSWLVSDDVGLKTFQRLYGVCVDFDMTPQCTPESPTKFLFAYSNNLNEDYFSGTVVAAIDMYITPFLSSQFSLLEAVRFDTEQENSVSSYSDAKDMVTGLYQALPNSADSFEDSSRESDVFKVIEKWLESPVCGARVFVLTERSMPDFNTQEIQTKLRKNRITLFTVSADYENSMVLANLALKTDGYGIISSSWQGYLASTPFFVPYYCIYTATVEVSGSGEINLPKLMVQNEARTWFHLIVFTEQGPTKIEGTENLRLIWSSTQHSGEMDPTNVPEDYDATHVPDNNSVRQDDTPKPGSYDMKLVYAFGETQTVNVRVYSESPVDYWVPYDN